MPSAEGEKHTTGEEMFAVDSPSSTQPQLAHSRPLTTRILDSCQIIHDENVLSVHRCACHGEECIEVRRRIGFTARVIEETERLTREECRTLCGGERDRGIHAAHEQREAVFPWWEVCRQLECEPAEVREDDLKKVRLIERIQHGVQCLDQTLARVFPA